MQHLDLFSGIGGFTIAAKLNGINTVGFSEIDPFACTVLAKHFPEIPNYGDIKEMSGELFRDFIGVDLITGGFPCTDLSQAAHGSHKHLDGEHSGLFWELARLINEIDPEWVVIENVPQVVKHMETVKQEMFAYEWSHRIFDSQNFGCACRRKRAYIVGHPEPGRADAVLNYAEKRGQVIRSRGAEDVLPMLLPWKGGVSLERLSSCLVEITETNAGGIRESDGIPGRLDGRRYLALGNSITPVIPFWIFAGMESVVC